MSRTRVHNLNISLDGFAAGDRVTFDEPIGGASALFGGFDGRVIHGVDALSDTGDPITVDRALTSTWSQGIGVEIMGRAKFGPQTGPWSDEDDWQGWWEDAPPFLTPVIVMTHHPRAPIRFENGSTFHFAGGTPQEILALATELAAGKDIRLGGGPSTVNAFLRADLVDFMHLIIKPLVLGRGVSLWDGVDGLPDRFGIESITTASGQVHQFWNRRR